MDNFENIQQLRGPLRNFKDLKGSKFKKLKNKQFAKN